MSDTIRGYLGVAKVLRLVLIDAPTNEQRDALIATALKTAYQAGWDACVRSTNEVNNIPNRLE